MNSNKFMWAIIFMFALMVSNTVCLAQNAERRSIQSPRGGRGGFKMDKSSDKELTKMVENVVPKFKQLQYVDEQTGLQMSYNLFIPSDYNPDKEYPLVMFMGDASTVGDDAKQPLTQGWGGLIWATEEEQAKHPAFVLVPQYSKTAVGDSWTTTEEVDMTIRLLQSICDSYNIDRTRLYTTGQSMGGMMSFYFNITYPHLFAASLFVGSQWDTSKMAPFIGNKFFYIVAAGDIKAPKGMTALEEVLKSEGVSPEKGEWSAKLPIDEQNAKVKAMIEKGNNINFITFTEGSVLPEDGSGNEHMYSFDYAYKLESVRDWLFNQRLDESAKATTPLVWANDGDWHGDKITPLMAIKKAIDKGADAAVLTVGKDNQEIVSGHCIGGSLLLSDALSLAKGRIKLVIRNTDGTPWSGELTSSQNDVVIVPIVSLDNNDWQTQIDQAIRLKAEFVELRYSQNDEQIKNALNMIDGKIKVVVNTTQNGLAGNHVDVTPRGNIQQAWGELKDMGVSAIITNQIKPMLKWLKQ